MLDGGDRPVGLFKGEELTSDRALTADSANGAPLVNLETSLRDALSILLASAVQTAIVVNERGAYQGVLTLETLGEAFRSEQATAHADGVSRTAERVR